MSITRLATAYRRPSDVRKVPGGLSIALSPNLRRDRVAFDGRLKRPLDFREAIAALHGVVVSDLRFVRRDRTAYEQFQKEIADREATIARQARGHAKADLLRQRTDPMPDGLEADFIEARRRYWQTRNRYSSYLLKHDAELWRRLMPCDPVITVAEDVLMFECFSADESSYACLTVDRDAFDDVQRCDLGTTNVDYSWSLYEHFQKLRSYRKTRFQIDPAGFEVDTADDAIGHIDGNHREEKIDLPKSWLRGFMQLQSAMALPMRTESITTGSMYNILAFLKRNRAKRSPRALRFEMEPGRKPSIVIEPYERRIEIGDTPHRGPASSIRLWGRDRLHVLTRLLPLATQIDVHMIDTGLPSFWVVHMRGMRLVLGLSGWTTNDWTAGSALAATFPPVQLSENELVGIAATFKHAPRASFDAIRNSAGLSATKTAAGLHSLAHVGQVIRDLATGDYRWRQVMSEPVTTDQLGADDDETTAADTIVRGGGVRIDSDTVVEGRRSVTGRAGRDRLELLIDGDGRIMKGKCNCSHHFKNNLRMGPCRHLQALRNVATSDDRPTTLDDWYRRYFTIAGVN